MNVTQYFYDIKTVQDVFMSFMGAIEDWEAGIEGTPTADQLKDLDKIYEIAETEVRFIVNNTPRLKDTDEAQ